MGQRKIHLALVNPQSLILIPKVNLIVITQPHMGNLSHHLRSSGLCAIEALIATLGLATIVTLDFAESVKTPTLLPVFLLVGIAMDTTVVVSEVFVDVHTLNLCADMHLVLSLPVVPLPLGLIPITTRTKLIMNMKL